MSETLNNDEDEIVSRILRPVAYAFEEECEALQADHSAKAAANTWNPLDGAINVNNVAMKANEIKIARADGLKSQTKHSMELSVRLGSPFARVAFGIIMWFGDAYTSSGVTTSWMSKSLLPVVLGVSNRFLSAASILIMLNRLVLSTYRSTLFTCSRICSLSPPLTTLNSQTRQLLVKLLPQACGLRKERKLSTMPFAMQESGSSFNLVALIYGIQLLCFC